MLPVVVEQIVISPCYKVNDGNIVMFKFLNFFCNCFSCDLTMHNIFRYFSESEKKISFNGFIGLYDNRIVKTMCYESVGQKRKQERISGFKFNSFVSIYVVACLYL